MEAALANKPYIERYLYPGTSNGFIVSENERFDKPAALMAYSRTLSMLREVLGSVAGRQTARKLIDETLPSNQFMPGWASSEGKPI